MNAMKIFELIIAAAGGILFLISAIGHIYVRARLKPKDSELQEYYYEFENQHPAMVRYTKWSRMTFTGAVVGALLIFLATAV
ncbi:MAG: hypothetical protein FVQ80_08880 [Planctomycetes bacterium]|nr:hypothetical protein [Planctomycetota bacterium]